MTLWFDVTDLMGWHAAQLTGIQRTVVYVLRESMKLRPDMRLFAFDVGRRILDEVGVADLPERVRIHLGIARVSAVPEELAPDANAIPQNPRPSPTARRKAWKRFRNKLQHKLGLRTQRAHDDPVRTAFRQFKLAAKDLRRSLREERARRKGKPRPPVAASSDLGGGSPLPQVQTLALGRTLFRRDDICLSLSATWGLPFYPETMSAHLEASGAKCVNLIYDLIPTLKPQWVLPIHVSVITLWARHQIVNADRIVTISQFQKREIGRYIEKAGLPDRPISVVKLGDDAGVVELVKAKITPLPRRVPDRRFVLCVSTLDIRKNHQCLYHVWARLAEELGSECPCLILVGLPHLHTEDLLLVMRNDPLVKRLIIHLRDIADEELAWYYANAAFTIYPSMYEGWGLPISESLAIGKYCIAANRTSLPEVGGDLVDYFDPLDYMECFRKVKRAIANPEYVKEKEKVIREQYPPSTWLDTARQVLAIVDDVAQENENPEPLAIAGRAS